MKHFQETKRFLIFKNLYIPHGSDETLLMVLPSAGKFSFISHMVQMKPQ